MNFGNNLQYLRRQHEGMTQEHLAERMGVSRQTISNWEMGESYPDVLRLMTLCDIFSCTLDALVREDLMAQNAAYSSVTLRRMPAMRLASYVMITPDPERDVLQYMADWISWAGLPQDTLRIGWDFPYVTQEQQHRFGLRGYAAACVLPEDWDGCTDGVKLSNQPEATYAVITIREPFVAPFERIPGAYKRIMEHLAANGFKEEPAHDCLPCFEHEYVRDGVTYMDVYVHVDSVGKGSLHTDFS